MGICNVVGSSISRETDAGIFTHAGPEIGVASTKAFIGQMLVLYIMSLKISKIRGNIVEKKYVEKIKNLKNLPKVIENSLKTEGLIQIFAKDF